MGKDIGTIGWVDISTGDAVALKDFYSSVLGTAIEPTSMGDYDDFTLTTLSDGAAIAGVCHARGSNASMPGGWMVYFHVADLDSSIETTEARGGSLIVAPRAYGDGRFCVIKDPDGNAAALYQA